MLGHAFLKFSRACSVDNLLEQAAEWAGEFRRRFPCDENDAIGRDVGGPAVIERVVGNRDIAPDIVTRKS
jgi:hypothetical protein